MSHDRFLLLPPAAAAKIRMEYVSLRIRAPPSCGYATGDAWTLVSMYVCAAAWRMRALHSYIESTQSCIVYVYGVCVILLSVHTLLF